MSARRSGRKLFRQLAAATTAIFLVSGLLAGPVSATQWPSRHLPNLVVLGDSYSAGVGNLPYIDSSGACKRSNGAYGPLLERYGVAKLQAFVACSGATTTQVSGLGPNNENPQINSITSDTDVVALTVLGNDFHISTLEAMCFSPAEGVNCNLATIVPFTVGNLPGPMTVQQVVDSIPQVGPALMDDLIAQIQHKLTKRGARIELMEYPNVVGNGGSYCPTLSAQELPVAQKIAENLNTVLRAAAQRDRVEFVAAGRYFVGHDACNPGSFIYTVPGAPESSEDPQGAFHPNRVGQGVYAAALTGKLYLR